PKMAQFMDQDHDTDQNQKPDNVLYNHHNVQAPNGTAFFLVSAREATSSRHTARDSLSISRIASIPFGWRTGVRARVSSTTSAMAGKLILPSRNDSTATSSAAFRVQLAEPPVSKAW